MNFITLIGRLTKDAELTVLPNGKTNIIKFSLAVERDYKDKEGKKPVDFINCEYVMNNDLSKLASYIKKGNQIAINGSLNIDKVKESYFTKVKVSKITLLGGKADNEAPLKEAIKEVEEMDEDVPF